MKLPPKAVPKFASFRPKPDQIAKPSICRDRALETKEDRFTSSEARRNSHQGNAHEHRSKRHDERRHKTRDGWHLPSQDKQALDDRPSIVVTPWGNEPNIFTVDKVGDIASLEYGSLHSYTVPSYVRAGSGRILGLSMDQKIDRQASSEKIITMCDSHGNQYTKRDKAVFARVGRGRETRVKSVASAAEHPIDVGADYLSLGHQRLKKRRRVELGVIPNSAESTEDENLHYRSIVGQAKPTINSEDSDLEYNDDFLDSESKALSTNDVSQRKVLLSTKVDLEPTNGDAWLELIEYQDTTLYHQSAKGKGSAAERASTADIKVSMYEKALTLVKDPQYTERLLLGMMEEGAKLWDARKIASKWQSLLQKNAGHIGLWTKYLDFQQTNLSAFRFDELRSAFAKCLGFLRDELAKAEATELKKNNLIYILAYVHLRLTSCMREAGFPEQSTAIWQAILEFNCCRPLTFAGKAKAVVSFETLLANFEHFWESEVPRFGEEDFHGWMNYSAHDERLPDPKTDELMPDASGSLLIAEWHEYEHTHFFRSRQPARTIDDTVEDDPYRVVLFSDIEDFIVDLPPSHHQTLLCAFLAFCQLPPLESLADDVRAWWRDPFIRNDGQRGWELFLQPLPPLSQVAEVQVQQGKDMSSPASIRVSSGPPTSFYLSSTTTLFAKAETWFCPFGQWTAQCAQNRGPVSVDWTRRALRALVDNNIGGGNLSEYLLALECSVAPSTAKKSAKALLKRQPSNLRLYNAYAIIEIRLGNFSAAQSVLMTAINMSRTLDETAQRETILLWRTWIWQILDSHDAASALARLLSLPDTVIKEDTKTIVANPAASLRAQKALADGRDQALSLADYRHALLYCECLVLLDYLQNPLSIEAALSTFEVQISLLTSRLPPKSPQHELLHQARAQLLYYHTSHTQLFKPALIRSTLTESIKLFPQNTIFLSLYAQNETRFRIDDRVRSIVSDLLLTNHSTGSSSNESIISHFFAVYAELNRSTTLGSNTHSIRGVFERAIDSQCGKQSAAMWKLYFLFEHSRGELQRARAVFYRAVRACPWMKELYLLPFEFLEDVVPMAELKGVYEMVVERELRVFVSLDEAFEEASERGR
ncbi:hypothetical protein MMC13_004174 [Lambiella insularis]|nr:hypothetical protein [Lambiella insularis]